MWSEARMVTKTATVSLFSNSYEVDPALVRRKVELVFDPLRACLRKGSYVRGRVMGVAAREWSPWGPFWARSPA